MPAAGNVGARFIAPACRHTVRWAMYTSCCRKPWPAVPWNSSGRQRTIAAANRRISRALEQRNQTKPMSHNLHLIQRLIRRIHSGPGTGRKPAVPIFLLGEGTQ